ncbi:uncharacterized protein LOC114680284 [Macaca mulatta]
MGAVPPRYSPDSERDSSLMVLLGDLYKENRWFYKELLPLRWALILPLPCEEVPSAMTVNFLKPPQPRRTIRHPESPRPDFEGITSSTLTPYGESTESSLPTGTKPSNLSLIHPLLETHVEGTGLRIDI